MGSGSSKKTKRQNEVKTDNEIYSTDSSLYDVCPSICKILYSNKKGTGFLIKLYLKDAPLFCLMTNEHIITKEMIENNDEIEVYYDNQKERIKIVLDNRERFIRNFKDKNLDYTVVEILLKDNIDKKYFLLPNLDYNKDNYKSLNNKKIFIVQFPEGNKLSHSSGNIIKIEDYELAHNAGTEPGSSGSPIFLIETTKVIGIHKSGDKYIKENYGDFIFPIIKILDNIKSGDKLNNYNNNYYDNNNNNNYKRTKVKKTHVNNTLSNSKVKDETALIDIIVELF